MFIIVDLSRLYIGVKWKRYILKKLNEILDYPKLL
jgi:hypothetical protein